MKPEELVRQYLPQIKIMQLATAIDNQPWVCTVHYFSDDELNLYWISTVDRRHSREIVRNPKVGAAILVHENTPTEDYVIGISIVGEAELVGNRIDESLGREFANKHGHRPELLDEIASGANKHKFYRIKPTQIILFDSHNFPDNPRQEINLDR